MNKTLQAAAALTLLLALKTLAPVARSVAQPSSSQPELERAPARALVLPQPITSKSKQVITPQLKRQLEAIANRADRIVAETSQVEKVVADAR